MMSSRSIPVAVLALVTGLLSAAQADIVLGRSGNCTAVWDTFGAATTSTRNRTNLTCEDGDASCDLDGEIDGVCTLQLNACIGQPTPDCPAPPAISGRLRFSRPSRRLFGGAPPNPELAPVCGETATLVAPLKRVPRNQNRPLKRYKNSKRTNLVMKARRFVNRLSVQCVPNQGGNGGGGGGLVCPLRTPSNLPAQLTLQVPLAQGAAGNGSDLDNGWTGSSHNFPIVGGSKLVYCLDGCDGTTTQDCVGTGQTGAGTPNTPTFGAPLPLLAANIPVCIVNRFQSPTITLAYNLATGAGGGDVNLFSDVYLTNNPTDVCPRCQAGAGAGIGATGTCSPNARNAGGPCTVEGVVTVAQGAGNRDYTLSSACVPQQSLLTATLDIRLPLQTGSNTRTGPLPCPDGIGPQSNDDSCGAGTCVPDSCTGTACLGRDGQNRCIDVKGGISQACCSNDSQIPCFPTRGGGAITRAGTPATSGQTAVFAATFCIDRTNSSLINTVTGLPGPGALLLPTAVTVLP